MHFGPVHQSSESLSTFKRRQARHAAIWLLALGLSLLLLSATAPRLQSSSSPGILLFLYFGFAIGTGMALLALLSFILGAWWTGKLERSPTASIRWKKVQAVLLALIILPLSAGAIYYFANGAATLEVPYLLARRGPSFVSWQANPIAFLLNMAALVGMGFAAPIVVFRKLKSTNVI
jgi:hypothetical protein